MWSLYRVTVVVVALDEVGHSGDVASYLCSSKSGPSMHSRIYTLAYLYMFDTAPRRITTRWIHVVHAIYCIGIAQFPELLQKEHFPSSTMLTQENP